MHLNMHLLSPCALFDLSPIMLVLPEQVDNLGVAQAANINRRGQFLSFPTPQA